jgi:decaprenyl-phosphate phosphoribosyltransferase
LKSYTRSLHLNPQGSRSEALSETVKIPKAGAYLAVIRPYQWIKNILVFAPMFFGGKFADTDLLLHAAGAAFMFSIAASTGYVFNDWMDRKEDRNHPKKSTRPFASEILNGKDAIFLGLILLSILIGMSLFLLPHYLLLTCVYAYFLMSVLYSSYFKRITLLEIYIVSFFFVMRVLAGGLATGTFISNWLFATVFFLSLLITVAKRKTEIMVIGKDSVNHRVSLQHYPVSYLDHLLWIAGGVSIVTYALYTVEKGQLLVFSLIPATYGITRFIMLTDKGDGGDPILALVKDSHLIIATLIFLTIIYSNIYL